MSGIDDLMGQSNARWASATRKAQGIADNGMGEALKTYFVLYFPAGVVILIAVGTLGGILAFGSGLDQWLSNVGFGCSLAALGVLVGGLVYNAKKIAPAAELGRIDLLISLENQERKRIRRQIRGRASLESEHLAVTRGAAVQMRKGLATQLVVAPFYPLAFIPQAVPGHSPLWWLMAIAVAAQAGAGVFLVRDFRQAGRFLARTAGPTVRTHSSDGQAGTGPPD
ncbi:hypothetical protein [Paenarthrobacter sp. PH39-S1]|uniref:hypothetical protein n=1 Tax=Paenarthrobacter sp. PH39-S1 TaxID=3046204 RepID=UPI0024BA4F91|nr:hypothetical protein [Paenarthrobacter sp. PH39-S1]MDJ0356531.1 hypothetical protein [Paenarthrobacter sp. PH39-S1]